MNNTNLSIPPVLRLLLLVLLFSSTTRAIHAFSAITTTTTTQQQRQQKQQCKHHHRATATSSTPPSSSQQQFHLHLNRDYHCESCMSSSSVALSLPMSGTTTTTRRSFGQRCLFWTTATFAGISLTTTASPLPAWALIDPDTALRNVRRAQRQLESSLKTMVDEQHYQEMREALRSDPLGSLRKNCYALVSIDPDSRTSAYQAFIAALEQLDANAGLILRGRNVPNTQMIQYYESTAQSLQVFVELVSTTATTTADATPDDDAASYK